MNPTPLVLHQHQTLICFLFPPGLGLPVSLVPRKRATVRRHVHGSGLDDGSDLDVMLVERLSELDDFLTQQGLDV